jgi:hypothetical protein
MGSEPGRRGALSRPPPVPRRRRRPPPSAGQRPRQQHLDPGLLQSRLEARPGVLRPSRRRPARQLLRGAPAGRAPGRRPGACSSTASAFASPTWSPGWRSSPAAPPTITTC